MRFITSEANATPSYAGLYIVEPHGRLIATGRKTAIVKARPFAFGPDPLVICSHGLAYGVAQLGPVEVLDKSFFARRFKEHRVTTTERQNWWPHADQFYLYPIVNFQPYPTPRAVVVPPGQQTLMGPVQFIDQKESVVPAQSGTEEPAMPYSKREDLSAPVQALPAHGQDIFLAAFNAAWDEYKEDDNREQRAFGTAWAAVKDVYEQDTDGNWVEKKKEEGEKSPPEGHPFYGNQWTGGSGGGGSETSVTTNQSPKNGAINDLPSERAATRPLFEKADFKKAPQQYSALGRENTWWEAANGAVIGVSYRSGGKYVVQEKFRTAESDDWSSDLGNYRDAINIARDDYPEFNSRESAQNYLQDQYNIVWNGQFRPEATDRSLPVGQRPAQQMENLQLDQARRWEKEVPREEKDLTESVDNSSSTSAVDHKAGRRVRGDKLTLLERLKEAWDEFWAWASYEDNAPGETEMEPDPDEEPEPGEENQVIATRTQGAGQQTVYKMVKGRDGQLWLILYTTNAFKDREEEIFTTKAIDDYVQRHLHEDVKGKFMFWHVPGTEFGTIRWQGLVGRLLVEAGTFDATPVGECFKAFLAEHPDGHPDIAPEGWGASHGYVYVPQDRQDKVYDWFDKEESSVLPAGAASNPHNLGLEVVAMLNEKQKAALQSIVGEDTAGEIIRRAEARTKELEAAGVAYKAAPEATKPGTAIRAVADEVTDEPTKKALGTIADQVDNGGDQAEAAQALRMLAGKTDGAVKDKLTACAAELAPAESKAQKPRKGDTPPVVVIAPETETEDDEEMETEDEAAMMAPAVKTKPAPVDMAELLSRFAVQYQLPDLTDAVQAVGETVLEMAAELKSLKEQLAAVETASKAAQAEAVQAATAAATKAAQEQQDNLPRYGRLFRASKDSTALNADQRQQYREPVGPPAVVSAIAEKISGGM